MTNGSPRRVGFVLYEGCTLLDFAGATQVFATWATQGNWAPVWLAPASGSAFSAVNPQAAVPGKLEPEYRPKDDKRPASVMTSEGVSVIPGESFCDCDGNPLSDLNLEVVFVPGAGGAATAQTMNDTRYRKFLSKCAEDPGGWVGSVCTGTYVVAAAGLLRKSPATTHWRVVEELAVLVDKGWIKSVPEGYPRSCLDKATRRFSGGGVSSSIDLALALLVELGAKPGQSGLVTANNSALMIQYEPSPPEGVGRGNPLDHQLDGITEAMTKASQAGLYDPIAQAASMLPSA